MTVGAESEEKQFIAWCVLMPLLAIGVSHRDAKMKKEASCVKYREVSIVLICLTHVEKMEKIEKIEKIEEDSKGMEVGQPLL